MKERQEHRQGMFPSHDQAPEISELGEGAFDFPTLAITAQLAPVLRGWSLAASAMRHTQFDAAPFQASAQGVAGVGLIGNQALRFLPRTTAARTRDGNRSQGRLQQRHFRRGSRLQVDSQRNTLAVDHHHALCAFPRLVSLAPPARAGVPTPGPLFWPVRTCHPQRLRSSRVVCVRPAWRGRPARSPARHLLPPTTGAVANKSKGWDIDPASPANGLPCAGSTECLPRPLGWEPRAVRLSSTWEELAIRVRSVSIVHRSRVAYVVGWPCSHLRPA